jgi:hypothetical protein
MHQLHVGEIIVTKLGDHFTSCSYYSNLELDFILCLDMVLLLLVPVHTRLFFNRYLGYVITTPAPPTPPT